MNNPRDILAQIQRRQAHRDARLASGAPRTPAPAPISAGSPVAPAPAADAPVARPVPPAPTAQAGAPTPEPAAQPAPRPASGHTLYRQLMRSHDRMGTRHLSQQEPGRGPGRDHRP